MPVTAALRANSRSISYVSGVSSATFAGSEARESWMYQLCIMTRLRTSTRTFSLYVQPCEMMAAMA